MPDEAVDVDYMMENIWIVGDPQECADRIRSLYEQTGGFGHLLAITQDPDDPDWEHECLQLLMEEVGPQGVRPARRLGNQVNCPKSPP